MSVLFGLLRKQKFHFIRAYKEEAFATIKESVKEVCRVYDGEWYGLFIVQVISIASFKYILEKYKSTSSARVFVLTINCTVICDNVCYIFM